MVRKGFWVLLCLMLVISAVIGCSNTSSPSAAEPSASDSQGTGENSSENQGEEPITIKLYTWYTADRFKWDVVYDAWKKEHPNINVEFVNLSQQQSSDEALKKIDLEAASGTELDIVMINNFREYIKRIELGVFEPLDDYMDFDYGDEYKVDLKANGKYYGLPGKFAQWYVLINKDHLEEANLPVPKDWTWDEYLEYAKKLTKGSGADKRYGTYFHTWGDYHRLAMKNQPELNYYLKPDRTSNMDHPGWKKSFEIRHQAEFVDGSAVPFADVVSQKMAYRDVFFSQKASMIVIGSWMNADIAGTEAVPVNFDVAVAPYPKNNPDDPAGYTWADNDIFTVGANSKHKEASYEFIRWFTTEGIVAQGNEVPTWRNAPVKDVIEKIISQGTTPERVDIDSLLHTLEVSEVVNMTTPVVYNSELEKAVQKQFELYMLGDQDLETSLQQAQQDVQSIIDAQK